MRKIKSAIFALLLSTPLAAWAESCPKGKTCLKNPLGTTELPVIVGYVIRAALGLIGSIALLMFIYGGFTWLTSGGSPDKVKKGKDIMVWAIIGLVLVFSSVALVQFVLNAFSR